MISSTMMFACRVWLVLQIILGAVSGLKDMRLFIPPAIKKGGTAVFACDFDPEGDLIYSVKWYKGSFEFFRFTPKDETPIKIFLMPGLHVDRSKSNMTRLTLLDVGTNMTGKYSCEVSVEQSFHTELVFGVMEVVETPSHPPVITGVKPRYRLGEILTANCSSGRSIPATNLTWFVNGEMVGLQHVEYFPLIKEAGMTRSQSRITFIVKSHDFVSYQLKLRCSANIHNIYTSDVEKAISEERISDVLVYNANFLDDIDPDGGQNRRRYSISMPGSGCSFHTKTNFGTTLLIFIFFIFR